MEPTSHLNAGVYHAFNVQQQIARFRQVFPTFEVPAALAYPQNTPIPDLLDAISRLLLIPALTRYTADAFRPLIMDLCSRWLFLAGLDDILVFEAFGLLVGVYEEIHPIMCEYLSDPSRSGGPLSILSSTNASNISTSHLHRLLLAYYRILKVDDLLPSRFEWPLWPLSTLMANTALDPGSRYLSIKCYASQVGMAQAERERLEVDALGELGILDVPIRYGEKILDDSSTIMPTEIDGWNLAYLELRRVQEWEESLRTLHPNSFLDLNGSPGPQDLRVHLSPYIVDAGGVLLFRRDTTLPPPTSFVQTQSSVECLQALGRLISQRLPALLSSSPGAGKASLIRHLAFQLFPNSRSPVVSLHLSDTSIDPKSLLGSYVSSATQPGTFEWVEGPVTTAMREGKWLVFEDIDKASSEVLGTIMPLVESLGIGKKHGDPARISIPGKGVIEASPDFALFATRSVPTSGTPLSSLMFLGHQYWSEVVLRSPSSSEQELILSALFPRLAGKPISSLIYMFTSIQHTIRTTSAGKRSSRDIGLRDLIKWTQRVEQLLPRDIAPSLDLNGNMDPSLLPSLIFSNPTVKELVFLEAQDIFFASDPSIFDETASIPVLAIVIANHLELSLDRVEWILRRRTPEFNVEKSPHDGGTVAVHIGRTRLQVSSSSPSLMLPNASEARPFAIHRPSLILLEKLALATLLSEPLLLVGETGTGKTSAIQHLASLLSQPLVVINLSNQTEASDLLGGFKPVDARIPASNLQLRFLDLFNRTFSLRRNTEYGDAVRKAVQGAKWKRVVALWRDSKTKAIERIETLSSKTELDSDAPRKRRKVDAEIEATDVSTTEWLEFERDVATFEAQHILAKSKFAFSFVEGPLVRAIRAGHWVLLDEINLASSETLEAITPLLQSPNSSLTLTDQSSLEPIPRHRSFRLFASMNPATDVGKKDLPPIFRSHFTEIWVPPPDTVREALLAIVQQYVGHVALADRAAILDVAEFYEAVRKLADSRRISDGSNHRPHFSMRTLARALTFAAEVSPSFGLRRALWEGCLMAFTMTLDPISAELVRPLAERHILSNVKNKRALLSQNPSLPSGATSRDGYVQVGPFFLLRGPLPLESADEYILTPSVQTKLIDLSRIILTRRFPVLIEGPTSAGKTSSIEYLARRTGHRFVRINNHEHTDIQEYIGAYVSDPRTGKLIFQDGILVRALRRGDWIVLDELNLAPTDVLEALNRLLDDNRELLIPETQEVVRPHPNFMLFATQNPTGLYAGRKVLSRAFRNRFLEVHFDDVPQAELETILCQRCRIAPSYAHRIVAVFHELQKRRQSSRVFESKHGFATLRDLFRWAGRDAVGYQQLAENGYMLLAERTRRSDDKVVVREVIESVMKVTIDTASFYDPAIENGPAQRLRLPFTKPNDLVWTSALQRTFVLVASALKHREPVLLVGETGAGKTSVCQLLAEVFGQQLHIVNCHQNTETADLLGGQRPIRNRTTLRANACSNAMSCLKTCGVEVDDVAFEDVHKYISLLETALHDKTLDPVHTAALRDARSGLHHAESFFEWQDGPLVKSMRSGDMFLLDEISLADDSVLERLNSVLEPSRTLVLAEKGGWDVDDVLVSAKDNFHLVATMNPGGDYGKKELSPALRNRFTEIWVPQVVERVDLHAIVHSMWRHSTSHALTDPVLDFSDWMLSEIGERSALGLRDILAWITFVNVTTDKNIPNLSTALLFHHGAHMTVLDGIPSLSSIVSLSTTSLSDLRLRAVDKLNRLVPLSPFEVSTLNSRLSSYSNGTFHLGPFNLELGPLPPHSDGFNVEAPTSRDNALRVLRACQVSKPILLEGSPGVGKTSLIAALAAMTGHPLCRVNLSEQTDVMDLFGSDLPVEGGKSGEFEWKDAAFLRALQNGDWVILDEMNLAPQSVLEGLNAVLDHRGTAYIPELGKSFSRHPNFRIFAAQNPLQQGGGRKGLPKSFLNRFTKVYIEELKEDDMIFICREVFPGCSDELLRSMIAFASKVQHETSLKRSFGRDGEPWEFNLRDILRWLSLLRRSSGLEMHLHPREYLDTIFLQRFRSNEDRNFVASVFHDVFPGHTVNHRSKPWPSITQNFVQIGHSLLPRLGKRPIRFRRSIVQNQLSALQAVGMCIQHGWLVILTGHSGVGKTSVIKLLADFAGARLDILSMNAAVDTADLLGGFEQVDLRNRLHQIGLQVMDAWEARCISAPPSQMLSYEELILRLRHVLFGPVEKTVSLNDLLEMIRRACAVVEEGFRAQILQQLEKIGNSTLSGSRFDWFDGPLVSALRFGHWLLLDNANLCNPAVLDRLNSLCETNGSLTLSERGLLDGETEVIRPHPNFRIFMTVDPRHGELSRAMRNRGVEVALLSQPEGPADGVQEMRRSTSHSSQLMRTEDSIIHTVSLLADVARLESSSTLSSIALHHIQYASISEWARISRAIPVSVLTISADQRKDLVHIMHSILTMPITATILHTRHDFKTNCPPLEFFTSQPFDLSVNPNLSKFSPVPPQVFELVMELRLLDEDFKSVIPSSPLSSSLQLERGHTVLTEIHPSIQWLAPLIRLTRIGAGNVLTHIMSTPLVERESVISVTALLLKYSEYLREIVSQTQFNLTAVRTIAMWFARMSGTITFLPKELLDTIESIHTATSLKTGLGMSELWLAFLKSDLPFSVRDQLYRLEEISCRLKDTGNAEALRARVLEVAALWGIRPSDDHGELAQLTTDLEHKLISQPVTSVDGTTHQDLALFLAAELEVIISGRTLQPDRIHFLCQIAMRTYGLKFIHLASLKNVLWNNEARAELDHPLVWAPVHLHWVRKIWELSDGADTVSDGPALLMRPLLLIHSLRASDWSAWTLDSLLKHQSSLGRQLSYTIRQYSSSAVPRSTRLCIMLVKTIFMVVQGLRDAYSEPIMRRISAIIDAFPNTLEPSLLVELGVLLVETDSPIKHSFRLHLISSLCGQDGNTPSTSDWAWIGEAWMALSLSLIHYYVPDAPLDPLIIQQTEAEFTDKSETRIKQYIAFAERMESLVSGNTTSPLLDELKQRLQRVTPFGPPIRNRLTQRSPDVFRLNALFTEISQFMSQVVPRVHHSLAHISSANHTTSTNTEAVIQDSITGFVQRLESAYSDLWDIIRPLVWLLHQLSMGLRIRIEAEHPRLADTAVSRNSVARSLTSFPTIAAVKKFRYFSSSSVGGISVPITGPEWVIHSLAGIEYEVTVGVTKITQAPELERHFDYLLSLWLLDREKERQDAIEANSLYRQQTYEGVDLGDTEAEEEEFRRIFPDFDGDDLSRAQPKKTPSSSSSSHHLSPSQIIDIARLHARLFRPRISPSGTSRASYTDRQRRALYSLLSKGAINLLSDSLDETSLPSRLSLLADRSTALHARSPEESISYDFYHGENVPEARKAISILQDCRSRLQLIMGEWPDQMVLVHLSEHVEKVLQLPIQSPLPRILAALERLLIHMQDWETYANRDNSLKAQGSNIATLIISWRRLELQCWAHLLDDQFASFSDGVAEWWFRLYELLVRGTLAASQDANPPKAVEEHITNLTPLLDDFITSSPIGQFESRLNLLFSFVKLIRALLVYEDGEQRSLALRRIVLIASSISEHYQLALPSVQEDLSRRRSTIEKDIRDYIKLASWKDVNIFALKQSAERTHRHLHRCLRKFRDILREPVSSTLFPGVPTDTSSLDRSTMSNHHVHISLSPPNFTLPPLLPRSAAPKYLRELPSTFSRFKAMLQAGVVPLFSAAPTQSMGEFAVLVISNVQSLASISITGTPEEKKKASKAASTRKRRALFDLLKEMKRLGVPVNLGANSLVQQQSRHLLLESHVSMDKFEPEFTAAIEKNNSYYHRLINGLQLARDAMRSHNSDLSTRDLQRLLMASEVTFFLGRKIRQMFAGVGESLHHLSRTSVRLRRLSSSAAASIISMGPLVKKRLTLVASKLKALTDALGELLQGCDVFDANRTEHPPLSSRVIGVIRDHLAASHALSDQISRLREDSDMSVNNILFTDERALLLAAEAHLKNACSLLQDAMSNEPRVRYLCEPLCDWLMDFHVDVLDVEQPEASGNIDPDPVINALLVVAQNLLPLTTAVTNTETDTDDNIVKKKMHTLAESFRALAPNVIQHQLDSFLGDLAKAPLQDGTFAQHEKSIAILVPFLENYLHSVRLFLADAVAWTNAMFKLAYVICSIVLTLAEKGFCKPQDAEPVDSNAGNGQTLEGTGLGEGAGTEDVSNEIQDESQVEGLEGEEGPQPPKDRGEEDSDSEGLEMSQDFDGEMEDVDRSEGEEDRDEDGDDASDIEEKVGGLEPQDPNAVDEKLWGDESKPEKESETRTDDSQSIQKPASEAQLAAKENETTSKDKESQDSPPVDGDNVSSKDDPGAEELPEEDSQPPGAGTKLDDHIQDVDTLDLPEDLNIDADRLEENDADAEEQDDDISGEAEVDEPVDPNNSDDFPADQERPQDQVSPDDVMGEGEEEQSPTAAERDMEADDGEEHSSDDLIDEEMEEAEARKTTSKPDVSEGGEAGEGMDQNADKAEPQGALATDNGVTAPSSIPEDAREIDQDRGDEPEPSMSDDPSQQLPGTQAEGGAQQVSAGTNSRGSNSRDQDPPLPNPLRSLGDALKEVRRRFDEISHRNEDFDTLKSANVPETIETEPAQIEYASPDDQDKEMQALGPSGPDVESTRLRDLHISEDDTLDAGDAPPADENMELDPPPVSAPEVPTSISHPQPSHREVANGDLEPALTEVQVRNTSDAVVDQSMEPPSDAADQDPSSTELVEEELVELRLERWQSLGQPDSQAQELWNLYEGLTHDLAYTLCEQLRLILEPTLATRLKGDYRTGKRLNMKKIIPYIASEFTKDKIWLRRTRPSKREYQILIALDDSKSMRQGRAGHLAFETMALVIKALGRLEAGDVGVMKFGQSVDVLHDFSSSPSGSAFNEKDGAKIMQSFRFDQKATNVLSLVEHSLGVLGEARSKRSSGSSSAADLWQLEIIISDGICQDHDKLRAALRKATEQRIMIVFIIVDGLRDPPPSTSAPPPNASSSSILTMKQATYTDVNGKKELQMQRYLDTFPFEYYVVLRNVEALPDVLSSTLKQFLERVSED